MRRYKKMQGKKIRFTKDLCGKCLDTERCKDRSARVIMCSSFMPMTTYWGFGVPSVKEGPKTPLGEGVET